MKNHLLKLLPVLLLVFAVGVRAEENPRPLIAWYGNLEAGLAVAKQTNRPVFLVSGAPACLGVPGIW